MLFYPICAYLLALLTASYFFAARYFLNTIGRTKKSDVLVILSLISTVAPCVLVFLYVYVYGNGGSAVAQFSTRSALWSLWFHTWPWVALASHVFAVISAISLFMDFKIKGNKYSFFARLFVFLLYPVALFLIYTTMPDA